jgi:predicted DNA-binding protein with PD1-like motif
MNIHRYEPGRVHLVSLETGDDVVPTITRYAADNEITAAWFTYLGAVRTAALRYYDQDARRYRDFTIDRHLEVLSGVGNVSLLDGQPFVHTHAAFADSVGRAFGGHLNTGCIVWALEVRLEEYSGEPPVRLYDDATGLNLWGQPV